MDPLTGAQVAEYIDGIVHLETQHRERGIDLTVDRVSRLTGPGSLDFGGSEFAPAPAEEVAAELASPDDDYGWWELPSGTYRIDYNEDPRILEGSLGLVIPLRRLLAAGAAHPSFTVFPGEVDEPFGTLLTVGEGGCRLKENCRVSTLLVLSTS